MLNYVNLDMDVLRSFVTGFEVGSFAKAAERLGRSQSAISTQLRKLEDQVGQTLVSKSGRGLQLTVAGESLMSYAKRLLELNDEAVERLRSAEVEGWVRLGMAQDFTESWLPGILLRFARAHPKARVEVRVEPSVTLAEHIVAGELDLALAWGRGSPHAAPVSELQIEWIGHPDWRPTPGDPLPLVAFQQPCLFRSAGIAALDKAGIPWRLAFSSPSLAGLWAAAAAGLGVTTRSAAAMPATLAALDGRAVGLPPLPTITLALHTAEADPPPAVARLAQILREMVAEHPSVPARSKRHHGRLSG
jgi:DNA-binding transcriptional LysR family regulator